MSLQANDYLYSLFLALSVRWVLEVALQNSLAEAIMFLYLIRISLYPACRGRGCRGLGGCFAIKPPGPYK